MKINRLALSSLVLASVTLGGVIGASPVMASTAAQMTAPTHIYLNGNGVSNPQHVVAKDPWSGSQTTWVPIYYLQQTLKEAGFQTTWDGTDLTFVQYPTNWKFNVALGNEEANPLVAPKGQMQIKLVKDAPPSMNFPKLVQKDPASGVATTYVPIYYVDSVLKRDFSMGAIWDGLRNNWDLTTQTPGATVTEETYPTTSDADAQIESIYHSHTYLSYDVGQTMNLGYGITANVAAGMDHDGIQWKEGNWTVEVASYGENTGARQIAENVVAYLHSYMLPAPNNRGVIVINSTDPNSKSFKATTTVAWQEGTKMYELQQSGDPVQALQAVINNQ